MCLVCASTIRCTPVISRPFALNISTIFCSNPKICIFIPWIIHKFYIVFISINIYIHHSRSIACYCLLPNALKSKSCWNLSIPSRYICLFSCFTFSSYGSSITVLFHIPFICSEIIILIVGIFHPVHNKVIGIFCFPYCIKRNIRCQFFSKSICGSIFF